MKFSDAAYNWLVYTLQSLGPNCQKVLPSYQTLLSDARALNFWDARVNGNVEQSSIPGVDPYPHANSTLGQAVAGANAAILLGPGGSISNQVVLGLGFFTENAALQGITLLHELLHYATQENDAQIDATYGVVYTGNTVNAASSAFSAWLANDCNNPSSH